MLCETVRGVESGSCLLNAHLVVFDEFTLCQTDERAALAAVKVVGM